MESSSESLSSTDNEKQEKNNSRLNKFKKKHFKLQKSKNFRASPNPVRIFWQRLKKYLQNRPEVYGSTVYKSLSKLKDVPIKKLKNLIFDFQNEREVVKKMYQEILEIFQQDRTFETEYPKYTQKLTIWFQNVLQKINPLEKKEESITIKQEKEELPNCLVQTDETITIPIWYLMGLQNQILYLSSSVLKAELDAPFSFHKT